MVGGGTEEARTSGTSEWPGADVRARPEAGRRAPRPGRAGQLATLAALEGFLGEEHGRGGGGGGGGRARALTAAKPVWRDSRKSAAHLSPSALVKIGFTASMVVKVVKVVVAAAALFHFLSARGQWGGG